MRQLKWAVILAVMCAFFVVPIASAAPASGQACGYWYQVRWGDTLSSIARYTGVSVGSISQANGLANPHYIYAGQWLWIPCGAPPPPPPSCGYWYTVRWGDTMNSIAWRTGVSSWAIARANGIYNLNRIYAGQALWIPCR